MTRYLKRAIEADDIAAATDNAAIKRQFMDVAKQWRDLARQAGYIADDDAKRSGF